MSYKLNIDNRNILEKKYLDLIIQIGALSKLKKEKLITDEIYRKSIMQINSIAH